MKTGARNTLLLSLFVSLAGCAASNDASRFGNGQDNVGQGGGSSGKGGGSSSSGNHAGSTSGLISNITDQCGNGRLDPNEECDDGNTDNGDGCNKACHVEADWSCPEAGKACVNTAVCGDGKLASTEQCDDGNTNGGDGCSADCDTIEDGWTCRVPGKACVPLCGDGKMTGTEQCDDNNTDNGDGCSSTCIIEPGWSCDPGGGCTKSQCGNGKVETGEICDKGTDNGLFLGDGTGCSKTCTPEPKCRDDKGVTGACQTSCGDGNIDPDEECDDGNGNDGDGCSHDCHSEPGFDCQKQDNKDTTACSSGGGDCLVLPITYHDFNGENKSDGHPDFFFYGSKGPGKSAATTCVPNASGHPDATWATSTDCSSNDSTALCSGLVSNTLGADGTPTASSNLSCDCRFTDWDAPHILAAGATGVTSCNVTNNGTRYRIEMKVNAITSADTFKDWYHDTSKSNKTVDKIELKQVGNSNQYQFAGNPRTIYDDLHDCFLGTGGKTSLDNNGFFPLDNATGRAMVCNIWPYWEPTLDTNCSAAKGQPIESQWDPRGWYADLNGIPTGCVKTGAGCPGGPIPGEGAMTASGAVLKGVKHNFYFTSIVRYYFRYAGNESLAFFGDDAVWVFINGQLALDLGAPHERLQGTVTLTGTGSSSSAAYAIQYQDSVTQDLKSPTNGTGTVNGLNLETGKTYEIAVFHADQHPRESNYQLTLSGYTTTRSVCQATCGDGVQTSTEQCDCGDANLDHLPDGCDQHNDDNAYGGCTTKCTLGPFCGDGNTDDPEEECDDGTQNNHGSYGDMNSCTPTCKRPHHCGDGIIDTDNGEECDDGDQNGQGACGTDCRFGQK